MREFSKPSELVQKQQPGSVRRMLFRLLFLFLLLKGFGRFAAFHLAELFLAQLLLLGFILTKVGFWAATSSSLVALRCHGCLLTLNMTPTQALAQRVPRRREEGRGLI